MLPLTKGSERCVEPTSNRDRCSNRHRSYRLANCAFATRGPHDHRRQDRARDHVGNTFGPNGLSIRFEPAGLVVEIAQIVLYEDDEPDPLADLRHPDVFAVANRWLRFPFRPLKQIRPQRVTVIV
jgi:hypothetical protein